MEESNLLPQIIATTTKIDGLDYRSVVSDPDDSAKALSDVNYTGFCLVEYETNYNCIESPLAESVGYYRGIMDAVEALGK